MIAGWVDRPPRRLRSRAFQGERDTPIGQGGPVGSVELEGGCCGRGTSGRCREATDLPWRSPLWIPQPRYGRAGPGRSARGQASARGVTTQRVYRARDGVLDRYQHPGAEVVVAGVFHVAANPRASPASMNLARDRRRWHRPAGAPSMASPRRNLRGHHWTAVDPGGRAVGPQHPVQPGGGHTRAVGCTDHDILVM